MESNIDQTPQDDTGVGRSEVSWLVALDVQKITQVYEKLLTNRLSFKA